LSQFSGVFHQTPESSINLITTPGDCSSNNNIDPRTIEKRVTRSTTAAALKKDNAVKYIRPATVKVSAMTLITETPANTEPANPSRNDTEETELAALSVLKLTEITAVVSILEDVSVSVESSAVVAESTQPPIATTMISGTPWSAEGCSTLNDCSINGNMEKDNLRLLKEDSSVSAVFPNIYDDDSSPTRIGQVTFPARSLRMNLSVIGESANDLFLRKPLQQSDSAEKTVSKPDIDLMRFNSISVEATGKSGKEKGGDTDLIEILVVAEEEEAMVNKKQTLLEEDADRLDGIPESTTNINNTVTIDNERFADQTLKRNLIHYVEAKVKPVVAKKTRFAKTAAKQMMLQCQKPITLSGDDDTLHEHLSNRDSDGVLVDAVEMEFDNEAFIPDTPVDDSSSSRQVYAHNNANDDDYGENNVVEEDRPTKISLNIDWYSSNDNSAKEPLQRISLPQRSEMLEGGKNFCEERERGRERGDREREGGERERGREIERQ